MFISILRGIATFFSFNLHQWATRKSIHRCLPSSRLLGLLLDKYFSDRSNRFRKPNNLKILASFESTLSNLCDLIWKFDFS